MNYLLFKRWNDFSGWLVFLIAAFVYGMTICQFLGLSRVYFMRREVTGRTSARCTFLYAGR